MAVFGRSRGCLNGLALFIMVLCGTQQVFGHASIASLFTDADIAQKLGAIIRELNPREVKQNDLPESR